MFEGVAVCFCLGECFIILRSPFCIFFWGKVKGLLRADCSREGGSESVVVLGCDRIELVIVATCASDGQAQEGDPDSCGHIIEFVVAGRLKLGFGELGGEGPCAEESGCHPSLWVVRLKFITGELPLSELVVGEIVIESADQEVAVVVSVWAIVVLFITEAFREADDIHPVACPAFTVFRSVE